MRISDDALVSLVVENAHRMNRDDVISKLEDLRQILVDRFDVAALYLFGSTARNEAYPESDVDLLVEFRQPVGLFHFIELQQYLTSHLGCQVDLGTKRSLRPEIADEVINGAIRVT